MKGSSKGLAPIALTTWQTENPGPPAPPWKTLRNPEKGAVHAALLAEQHHVCIYCGKRITTEFHSSHIEHFYPQSIHTEQRFDWQNLFASCGPTGKAHTPTTCGDAKDNWDPAGSGHVHPTDPACEQRFAYDGDGAIVPAAAGDADAQRMIDILNLDDDSLRSERSAIISELEARIGDGSIDAANKAQEVAMWRSIGDDGRLIGYGHVAARYLEDQPL